MTSVFRGTEPQSPEFPRLVIKIWLSSDWSTTLNDSFKWQMNPATVSRIQIWWRSLINGKTFVWLRVCFIVSQQWRIYHRSICSCWGSDFWEVVKNALCLESFLKLQSSQKCRPQQRRAVCSTNLRPEAHLVMINKLLESCVMMQSFPCLGIRTQNHGAVGSVAGPFS